MTNWLNPYTFVEVLELSVGEYFGHRSISRKVIVPDFVGLSVPDMWAKTLKSGVKVDIHQISPEHPIAGLVVAQRPAAGARVRRGTTVECDVTFEPVKTKPVKRPVWKTPDQGKAGRRRRG